MCVIVIVVFSLDMHSHKFVQISVSFIIFVMIVQHDAHTSFAMTRCHCKLIYMAAGVQHVAQSPERHIQQVLGPTNCRPQLTNYITPQMSC